MASEACTTAETKMPLRHRAFKDALAATTSCSAPEKPGQQGFVRRGRDGADAHPFQSKGIQIIEIIFIALTHAPHQALHLIGPPQSLILRRRGSVGEYLAAYAQHSERSLIGGRVECIRGMSFYPSLLQCLSSAFGPLLHASDKKLGRLFEHFKIG